jgi:DNA-binding response OmpR family regulator
MSSAPSQGQAERPPDETAPTPAEPTAPAPDPTPFSRSVVIADDEESIADAVAMLIEEAGFTPLVAPNGKVALELVRAHHPALVITDLMMPIMDGAVLIATLRAEAHVDGAHPPPILLLSAAPASVAADAHADAYLSKPFDLGALEECIAQLLARS